MKKLICLSFIAMTVLCGCTKKADTTPAPTVTIEGTAYNTVVIGNMTWTSQNYNGPGGVYYNNNPSNTQTYGKLYTFSEAQSIQLPDGWRLPTEDDYSYLISFDNLDAKTLMSKSTWDIGGGTNSLGFNAIAAGYEKNSTFMNQGGYAVFVTPTTNATVPGLGTFAIFQGNANGKLYTYAFLTNILITDTDRGSLRFVKDN